MSTSSNVLLARMLARSRLRQWQLVQEVAALGSVQRAADAVGMSQPAATHAIAELESLLGVPLFERHARGTRLTPAGQATVAKVRLAMEAFADCADVVSSMLAGSSGVLHVGAIGAAISGLLSLALPAFSLRHPAAAVQVEQQSPHELLLNLFEGSIDLALCRRPAQMPAEAVYLDLLSDRYAIVCSPRHALAGRAGVTPAELAEHLWLMPPTSTIAERDFHSLWAGHGLPEQLCWIESRVLLLTWPMVEQRQALALIPRNAARQWLDAGILAEVPGAWGPSLEPIGVLMRLADVGATGALGALLLELQRWGDIPASA